MSDRDTSLVGKGLCAATHAQDHPNRDYPIIGVSRRRASAGRTGLYAGWTTTSKVSISGSLETNDAVSARWAAMCGDARCEASPASSS